MLNVFSCQFGDIKPMVEKKFKTFFLCDCLGEGSWENTKLNQFCSLRSRVWWWQQNFIQKKGENYIKDLNLKKTYIICFFLGILEK